MVIEVIISNLRIMRVIDLDKLSFIDDLYSDTCVTCR